MIIIFVVIPERFIIPCRYLINNDNIISNMNHVYITALHHLVTEFVKLFNIIENAFIFIIIQQREFILLNRQRSIVYLDGKANQDLNISTHA